MPYEIEIEEVEDFPKALFEVKVSSDEGKDETVHTVSLSKSYYERLSEREVLPEEFVKASFLFLLEREPNTAILSEFDIKDIQKYFPEFEGKVISYFNNL